MSTLRSRTPFNRRGDHVRCVSRRPSLAQIPGLPGGGDGGNLSPIESAVIFVISIFFSGWDNYASVISNLQKYYSKTPS